jgi:hypothetical protein
VAIAGRITPGVRPSPNTAAAATAPELPAETIASASLLFTRSMQMLIEHSFFLRTAVAGDSSMPIDSGACTILRRL